MLIPILLFALGLLCLIEGGDWFVDGAEGIARRFHLPELLIGATVVSIGTTLPEVMVSAGSALKGVGDIAYGNAIGSIICNTALIAAIPILAKPGKVDPKTLRLPVAFFFLAACLYAAVSYFSGYFSRPIGIVLLALFVLYMILTVRAMKAAPVDELPPEDEADNPAAEEGAKWLRPLRAWQARFPFLFDVISLVVGAAAIAIGADLLVDNGILIAEALGVPESVIGLTFVALGTSLPELVTAIASLVKGHSSLSLGNVIGANLFNLVLVSGAAVTLSPFSLPVEKAVAGINSSLLIDLPMMFAVMLLLTVPALRRGKLSRLQGGILLGLYVAFLAVQFLM